jgi:hypothetical protein
MVPGHDERHAAAILVTCTKERFGFCFVDWAQSPWAEEYYLGRQLDRGAALRSEFRCTFLHIAEHVVEDLPEAAEYFGGADGP